MEAGAGSEPTPSRQGGARPFDGGSSPARPHLKRGVFASEQRTGPGTARLGPRDQAPVRGPASSDQPAPQRTSIVNQIVWLVGAVVIVLFVLGYFGLR